MKVAVIIDTWFPHLGGGQINAWEISKRITGQGVYIDVITRDNGTTNLKASKNLNIIRLGPRAKPFDNFSKLAFLARSLFYLYSHNYDLIHAHAFLPGIVARLIMVTKGIPTIFTIHGTSLGTQLLTPFQKLVEKFILTQILYSAQITVSRDFLNFKNINKKIFYIANGINISDFDKVKSTKFKNPTLIFVGRLHPQKNLSMLIHSTSLLSKEIPQMDLLIVGNGPDKSCLEKMARQLKLTKVVKFLGEVKGAELIKLYKSSHIFVLPSVYEGLPLTVLEAWAAKIPVITSRSGDLLYLVKNGQNGYLLDNQFDPRELANIIKKAITSVNLSKLGERGYNLVKKNFSWDQSAQKTLELYKSLTNV